MAGRLLLRSIGHVAMCSLVLISALGVGEGSLAGHGRVVLGDDVALTGTRCPSHVRTIHRIRSRLRVCGKILRDSRGRKVRIFSLDDWPVTPTFSYRDIGNWGFNAVRLSVSWDALEPAPPTHGADGKPVHAWDPTYLAQLDQAIAGFHSHGVAVILAMSQHLWSPAFTNLEHGGRIFPTGAGMPAWLYPQGGGLCEMVKAEKGFFIRGVGQSEFRAAWRFLAGRYARNPAVIGADMLNEPYDVLTSSYPCTAGATPKTMKLARFYEATGKSIHRANSHLLLMFQEQKSRRTKRWALTRKPVLPNSVFDMHLYAPSWDQGRDRLGAAYRRAAHWHLPVWVGEWTMYNRTTNMQDAFAKWQYSSKKTLAYCKEHGISWDVLGYGAGRFQKATAIRTPKAGVLKTVRGGF